MADKQSLNVYPKQRALKMKIKFRDFPAIVNFYEAVRQKEEYCFVCIFFSFLTRYFPASLTFRGH